MSSKTSLNKLIEITNEILRTKYPSAEFAYLAGSIVRGEGTAFSDLDIVVVYKELPNAFRESFYFQEFPVETFVHTPETLNYFIFDVDHPSTVASLARMVSEGIEVPKKSELSEKLKRLVNEYLTQPPKISDDEKCNVRCHITDLVDDIRAPRSKEELTASATVLYTVLADFYFRANGFWSAKSKTIPRHFQKINPELYQNFCASFEELFVAGKPEKVIELAGELLAPHGGFLFDGLRLDSLPDCRKPLE